MEFIGGIIFLVVLNLVVLVTCQLNTGDTYSNCVKPRARVSCGPQHRLLSGFRTIDGTCNHLRHPMAGAANTPLRRLLRADYVDGTDTPRGFPGTSPVVPPANQVSNATFRVERTNKGNGHLTVLFMTFGQFFDHDLALATHPECHEKSCADKNKAFKYPCFPILFERGESRCTGFARAVPVCQNDFQRQRGHSRIQTNELTSFIDASQVYGSEINHSRRLRTLDGTGRMKVTEQDLLPLDTERKEPCMVDGGCSLVGDRRGDENIALLSMHTLWVREHNRIATELKIVNPHWDDERLYQHARKIVGAIMQDIVYTEWLPNIVRLNRYRGYSPRLNPTIRNAFTAVAFRFGHSLIPNKFSQLNSNFDYKFQPVELQAAFRNRKLILNRGIESTLFGLLGNRSGNVDDGFAFGIMHRLLVKPGKTDHMDLTAFNIQRGRDHGIPTYGRWRDACLLPPVRTFDDLRQYMLPDIVDRLQKIYKSPNDIDLFAAGISEKHVPGLQIGPTFECIFRYQFRRLSEGDRYFYRNGGVFTPFQFQEIRKASMARVLCDNLKGIVSIQPNAFHMEDTRNRRVSCDRIPRINLFAWKE